MTILTFTFFITIISALSVFSGFDFASALEEASANNVSRKGHGRILDLGLSGRIIAAIEKSRAAKHISKMCTDFSSCP